MRAMRWSMGVGAAVLAAVAAVGCGSSGTSSPPPQNPTITSVSVAVSPSAITTAQTAQATATVMGTGNYSSAVTWSVSPSSMGTVSSAGMFTPATTGTATITATSTEDATKSGSAPVTVGAASAITGVTVTVSPTTITTAQTAVASATVTGTGAYSNAVTWSVSPAGIGTISNTGLFTPATTGTATITATSNQDTTVSGSATLMVTAAPTIMGVMVTANPATITTAQTSQATATVMGTGAFSTGVTWSVSPTGIGAISAAGLFTPSMTGTATITATSTEDKTKSGSATVTVNAVPAITAVTVTVSPATITTAQTAQATATVTGTGAYSSTVTWAVGPAGIGTISSAGLFAPATTGTATITATSTEDTTKTGSATLPITTALPTITGVTVTPNPATATIGTTEQFTATVSGTGAYNKSVSWSVAGPAGWTGSVGSISGSGLYETPYPAPATVTVTATSVGNTSVSGSVTVTLAAPAASTGPALTVDAGDPLHVISPLIYGMNSYALTNVDLAQGNVPVARWGGDNTSRYNYQANTSNSASDYYFLNGQGAGGMIGGGAFTSFISSVHGEGTEALGTVPVLGWVTNSSTTACSFTEASYPGQQSYVGSCGNGVYKQGSGGCTSASGCDIYGNATVAAITSVSEPPPANSAATMPAASAATTTWAQGTWAGGWVNQILGLYGQANPATGTGKGVNIWDLDNEPAWWDAVHRDVHPVASTYDEVTYGGISTALAIKTIDPTALVSGPVIDYWWNYFYSKQDIENGWSHGACYQPWDDPTDREAHGGVPMIEYYLQQFANAQTTYGMRLLDYVDIHGYYAATYNGSSVGLTTAGDTAEQQARLNSTRVLWDPTYTDPNEPQPNYPTDANYTTSCSVPLQAPELIPMLKSWVAKDYPGTKTAIDEYNWGGLESMNGALAQADVLGIFGQYGLDLGALWGPPTSTQTPGLMAFAIYRNYDGSDSMFGGTALASCSGTAAAACDATGTNAAAQNQLAVYGALRSSDNAVTVVVINKTYGALSTTLSLENVTTPGAAQVFQYSDANLNAIVAQPSVTVTPPSGGGTTSTIGYTFPGASITLFVIPQ